jgi:DNA invertase Pin-like site-specific DNA recombinase
LAAEIERNLISQRTREALAAKKQEGVKLGRPKGKTAARRRFDAMLPEIIEMKQKGEDTDAIAARLGIHRNTFYRYLRAATEENAKK